MSLLCQAIRVQAKRLTRCSRRDVETGQEADANNADRDAIESHDGIENQHEFPYEARPADL